MASDATRERPEQAEIPGYDPLDRVDISPKGRHDAAESDNYGKHPAVAQPLSIVKLLVLYR